MQTSRAHVNADDLLGPWPRSRPRPRPPILSHTSIATAATTSTPTTISTPYPLPPMLISTIAPPDLQDPSVELNRHYSSRPIVEFARVWTEIATSPSNHAYLSFVIATQRVLWYRYGMGCIQPKDQDPAVLGI